ncbi:response regulator transcription factor [Rhodoblastus sp.]|jgi:DNA-binding response OmpR family regulator|uniref:response regulator transcription factor n=1 Tax=Rhodoblastus sp. TaxID=1962975 RepID=UPI0025DD1D49|nr:response regulator transcription factor [Rhodoblastus sp.]
MRILLAEDNERLAALIMEGLTAEGFTLDHFGTLADADDAARSVNYDLILLDLGMPDGDGVDFIRNLRRRAATPVLVITARDGLGDRVTGLDSGADDYLVKPFELSELAARCRALLRRPGACLGVTLKLANLEFDSAGREVRVAGKPIRLSPRERDLLERLMRRAGHVVAKESLEEALYSLEAPVTPNALEAAVSRLRRSLSSAQADVIVHTAHGIGYMLTGKQAADHV